MTAPEYRTVLHTTQAHRREIRLGELSAGERLPFHPSLEATVVTLVGIGVGLVVAKLWGWVHLPFPRAIWLVGLPLTLYLTVQGLQGVGRSPVVAADAAIQYLLDQLTWLIRALERPQAYRHSTPIITLKDDDVED